MEPSQVRDTVVIVNSLPEGSDALRAGLSRQWVALEPALTDFGEKGVDELAAAMSGLAPERFGVVGVAMGAAAAVRYALRSPDRVTALALVSPLLASPQSGGGDPDLAGRLAEIQCPTLAVFGQQDPTAASASLYRERIPNCNIAFVYDAGHNIPAQRPQALLNLVSDYLERRETFIVQNRTGLISP